MVGYIDIIASFMKVQCFPVSHISFFVGGGAKMDGDHGQIGYLGQPLFTGVRYN